MRIKANISKEEKDCYLMCKKKYFFHVDFPDYKK